MHAAHGQTRIYYIFIQTVDRSIFITYSLLQLCEADEWAITRPAL